MATDREAQLLQAAHAAGITSRTELANFMAQVGHESGGLNRLNEGFRYTRDSAQISSNVRSALREGPEALEAARLEALQGQPERLAELMYGGRMGNDQPGDGFRYHGRGYIQLTGKNQYRAAGEALDLDLVRNPDLAAAPENAARIATWYWQQNVPAATRDSVRAAGAAINGSDPPNGLADREARFERWNRDITPELMGNLAAGRLGQPVPPPGAPAARAADAAPVAAAAGFAGVMRTMLPPQNGVSPHITSDFGPRSVAGGSSDHRGVDFNYRGGQSGTNLQHPTVRSPVSGEVVFSGGQYGTVKIRDGEGNMHEVLHLNSRAVQLTDPPTRVNAGDPIGTMGGRGPNGAGQYAQHVHYQVRDPSGQTVDPERFWNGRQVQAPAAAGTEARTKAGAAAGGGALRLNVRGPEVIALQESLNRLGYTGRDGRPLETQSGIYGEETKHAVQALQRAHGVGVDGVVGRDTRGALAAAIASPLMSEASHPNHRLFSEIARQLPTGTRPEVAANVTLQAMENGITSPERLAGVMVRDGNVFVGGHLPGERVRVDLNAPTPTMQQMSDHTRQQSAQPAQQEPARTQDPVQSSDTETLRPRTMHA